MPSPVCRCTEGTRASDLLCSEVQSNLSILQSVRQAGGGFDIVSGGELQRVPGGWRQANKWCFSGVGKMWPKCASAGRGDFVFYVESRSGT